MSAELGSSSATEGGRCPWAEHGGDLERAYHDLEWGMPHHGDQELFELLTLEGAQAGLSWSLVLSRREGYRRAFAGFDPLVIAGWPEDKVAELVLDPGIIRHRGKIASVLSNARAVCSLREEGTDLDTFLWSFTGGTPLQPRFRTLADVPTTTDVAAALSRGLKRRGFSFVGPTIAYAFMQAAGMTNDHVAGCFRGSELDT